MKIKQWICTKNIHYNSQDKELEVTERIIEVIEANIVSPHSPPLGIFSFLESPEFKLRKEVLNKCLYGEAPARGPTPYPFIYHFSRKMYPFRIPSIDKWYPFHIPCLKLFISFNCCKCVVFSVGTNHKNKRFSRLYKAIKFISQPFGSFHRPKWQISLHFHILERVKSLPFHIREAWKRYPFRAEPSRIGQRVPPSPGIQIFKSKSEERLRFRVLVNKPFHFVLCTYTFIMLSAKLKPLSRMQTTKSFWAGQLMSDLWRRTGRWTVWDDKPKGKEGVLTRELIRHQYTIKRNWTAKSKFAISAGSPDYQVRTFSCSMCTVSVLTC